LQPFLQAARSGPPIDFDQPVAQLRAAADAGVISTVALVRQPEIELEVADYVVAVDGSSIPVRIYRPRSEPLLPVHVHLHGGGWWMGSIETTDAACRDFSAASGLAVISVGYRLAPEHPWPTPIEDVYAALLWTADNAQELGLDVGSISVGGESAGANLAAVVSLMARDRGGPLLVGVWLDVPATDLNMPPTASDKEYGESFGLDTSAVEKCVQWYVASDNLEHPYVSPLLAADLRGLPPTVITVAECDPLRDQGEAYATRLQEAGVPTRMRRWAGHLHATMWLTALTESARDWQAFVIEALADFRAMQSRSAVASVQVEEK
jgi:acetyl esterase